jgi:hypothetical protein
LERVDAFLHLLQIQEVVNECHGKCHLTHHEAAKLQNFDHEFSRQVRFRHHCHDLLEEENGRVERGTYLVTHRRCEGFALLELYFLLLVDDLVDFAIYPFCHVSNVQGNRWPPKIVLLLDLDADELTLFFAV